jgi:hypothetical protein
VIAERTGVIAERAGVIAERTGVIAERTGMIAERTLMEIRDSVPVSQGPMVRVVVVIGRPRNVRHPLDFPPVGETRVS